MLEADNNFEIGGVLVGYRFWKFNFVVAATVSDAGENGSKVFFLLDGVEHTEKVNEIAESGFIWPPSVLGIWHSHICDGHNFSQQDKISNRVFAKTFGGALSMLVTQQAQTVLFSISYISDAGVEKDCTINLQNKAKTGGEKYGQQRKMQ